MNKLIGTLLVASMLVITSPLIASAQSGNGLTIYQNVLMGKTKCANLSNGDFLAVGDYVLKQVPESQRASLNIYINQYKGTMNDTDFSTMMGKIFTGCEIPTAAGNMMNGGVNSGAVAANAIAGGLANSYGGYIGMMSGIGMIFSLISYVIGLIIFILIAKFLWRLFGGKKEMVNLVKMNTGESATDILKERYAKGEISTEEYEEKRKELTK